MKNKRRIVVDASIARAAGDVSLHPSSKSCRDTLLAVSDHAAVFSPLLFGEWNKHQSNFARSWRLKMVQENRVVFLSNDLEIINICEFIDETSANLSDKNAMVKDAHLLSAAIVNDKIILALDEKVRKLVSRFFNGNLRISSIHWSNPTCIEDDTIGWLKAGAKNNKAFTLGAFAK